jgi:biotin operon repressor
MSNDVLNWAKRVTAGGQTRKAVLLLLADYADEKGRAWPSQGTLAETLEMSERTVRTAIKELVEAGIISRKARWRDDGTRGTDILKFDMDAVNRNELPVINQPANGAETTGKSRQINRQMAPTLPAAPAANPSQGEPPQGNHQSNSSEANASGTAEAEPIAMPLRDRLWLEGPAALVSIGASDKPSRQMIGRWLRDNDGDAGRVLWAIEEAVTHGTGDPIPYVTRLLAERRPGNVTSFSAYPAGRSRSAKDDNIAAAMAEFTGGGRQRSGCEPRDDGWRRPDEASSDATGAYDADPGATRATGRDDRHRLACLRSPEPRCAVGASEGGDLSAGA